MEFVCNCCNYNTNVKANYNKHLLTDKHIKVSQKLAKVSPIVVEVSQKLAKVSHEISNQFKCKYCEQGYKHKSSLSKHIKYSCTKNKTEDLTELVRLLNLQLEQQKNDFQSQLQTQTKQIEKLMSKLEINYNTQNTNSNNTTINNVVNVNLLNYDDTDTSHLTDKDYEKCIKQVYNCVMKMIEKVHFNPEKPENMNLYISNIKSNHMMMYKDNKWLLVNNKELESIYADKDNLINTWIEVNKIKDKELLEKFNKCTNMDEDTLKSVYDEIKLLMFNQRDVVKNQIKN